jgi:uncharacterized NAD(P)/FAD-binding protein YdhS
VNCCGIGRVAAMMRDPLLRTMLARDLTSPDEGGLGFRATWDLAAIDSSGRRVPGLWIVGPPVRGSRFEATSVPELRGMAASAASQILRAIRPAAAAI